MVHSTRCYYVTYRFLSPPPPMAPKVGHRRRGGGSNASPYSPLSILPSSSPPPVGNGLMWLVINRQMITTKTRNISTSKVSDSSGNPYGPVSYVAAQDAATRFYPQFYSLIASASLQHRYVSPHSRSGIRMYRVRRTVHRSPASANCRPTQGVVTGGKVS